MKKRIVFFAILALLIASTAWAQIGFGYSLTQAASGGLFQGDQDKFFSPLFWSEVEGNILFLQLGRPGSISGDFQIAASNRFGAVYVAGGTVLSLSQTDSGTKKTTNDTLRLDGNQLVIGKDVTATYSQDKTNNYWVQIPVLVGLMGNLGIANNFSSWDGTQTATFDDSGNFQTAQDVYVTDLAGAVLASSATSYAAGVKKDTDLGDTLSAGYKMAAGPGTLYAGFDFVFRATDGSASFGERTLNTAASGGVAYTPASSLDGTTPAAIPNTLYFNQSEYEEMNKSIVLSPDLVIAYSMPLAGIWSLYGSLGYDFSTTLWNNAYTDLAGAAASVAGTATYAESVTFQPGYDLTNNGPDSTSTRNQTLNLHARSAMSNAINLQAQLTATPSELLKFSFAYAPGITFSTSSESFSKTDVATTTYVDGTGLATGLGSYVETTTNTDSGTAYEYATTRLTNYFATALQFYLVPKKFRVNLGGSATIADINLYANQKTTTGLTTSVTSRATSGAAAVQTAYGVNSTFLGGNEFQDNTDNDVNGSDASFSMGMTYFFSPEFTLDMYFMGGDLWNTNNYYIQATLKY